MFAVVSLVFCLTGSLVAIVMGAGLTVIAVVEFVGGSRLRRLSERGAVILACNQAGFALLLVGYAVWMLVATSGAPTLSSQIAVADPEMAEMFDRLERLMRVLVYGGVAAAGLFVPGLTSLFYLTRLSHLRRYRRQTPVWAQRAIERITN